MKRVLTYKKNNLSHIQGRFLSCKGIAMGIVLLMALLVTKVSNAQYENQGDSVYLGSRHLYIVNIDSVSNTQQWFLTDSITTYDLIGGGYAWVNYIPTVSDGGPDSVEIYFDRTPFFNNNAGMHDPDKDWYLIYKEFDSSDNCIAIRSFRFRIFESMFGEYINENITEECHDSSGTVQNWNLINGVNFPTSVEFQVVMNKDANFILNSWEFNGTITQSQTVGVSYSLSSVTADATSLGGGSVSLNNLTLNANDGTFTILCTAPTNLNETADTLTISVVLTGFMYEGCELRLDVSNGMARSVYQPPTGSGYEIVTMDNIAIYPQAPGTPGDRSHTIVINSLPATVNITVSD